LDHVVRVWAADRLCHHVVHTERLEYRAHRAAGDDPGPRLGGAHDHVAGAVAADDVVMQGAPLAQRHADHAAPRLLGGLANGFRHFSGLARAIAHPTLAVPDYDQRGETKASAALPDLGDTIDVDQLLGELAVLAPVP